MIIENPDLNLSYNQHKNFFGSGVIFDSNVLLIFFLDLYVKINPQKHYLLQKINITASQISCLNTIITNYKIKKIIITPHILSEFLNRIRRDLKLDYKDIKKECLEDLKRMDEIYVHKNSMLSHSSFFDFGNDISLLIATEDQIQKNKYSCILSFDGRFIENFFRKNDNILAFKLDTLQYFY